MAIDVPDFVKLDEQSDGVKMLVVQLGGRNISNETLGLRIQMLEKSLGWTKGYLVLMGLYLFRKKDPEQK